MSVQLSYIFRLSSAFQQLHAFAVLSTHVTICWNDMSRFIIPPFWMKLANCVTLRISILLNITPTVLKQGWYLMPEFFGRGYWNFYEWWTVFHRVFFHSNCVKWILLIVIWDFDFFKNPSIIYHVLKFVYGVGVICDCFPLKKCKGISFGREFVFLFDYHTHPKSLSTTKNRISPNRV